MSKNSPNLREMLELAKKCGVTSIDIEHDPNTNYLDPDFKLHGCGFSTLDGEDIVAIYMTDPAEIQLALDELTTNSVEVVGHYFQSDLLAFMGAGYTFAKDPIVRDTAVAYNLLFDEWSDKDLGLKTLSPKILGEEMAHFEEVCDDMDSPEFEAYAKDDVIKQLTLYLKAKPQLEALNLNQPYHIICDSVVSFAEMIYNGMAISIEAAEDIFNRLCALQDELTYEIYKLIGRVDLNSPKQLGNRLFKELGYNAKRLNVSEKTGVISTGEKNMVKLAQKYPACEAIMAYRGCGKGISTYVDPLVEQALLHDGRAYDYFYLTSTTGRTRAKMFQVIPNKLGGDIKHNQTLKEYFKQLKLREMFVAPEGRKLVVADFSSLEYRTSAIAAGETKMIDMYQHWECGNCKSQGKSNLVLHSCPKCGASEGFSQGKDLHAYMRDESNKVGAGINRQQAKAVSFLTIFNGSAGKLAADLGLPYRQGKVIQDAIFNDFKLIKAWHKKAEEIVATTGEVRDFMGRRRKVNMAERLRGASKDMHPWIIKNAVNQIVNFQAQSPACLIGQVAVRKLRRRLIEENLWNNGIWFICFLHDEIVLEANEDLAEYALEVLTWAMETAVTLDVPLPVEGGIYDNWSQAK